MSISINEKLEFAKTIAVQLGEVAIKIRTESTADDFISSKGTRDFVTVADNAVEEMFRKAVSEKYPNDGVLGEENGADDLTGEGCWVIDPIDGTSNYMKGCPDWSISIAYVYNGEIVAGVIYVPETNQTLWASKGQGAFCNGQSISVSKCDSTEQATIMFGSF